MQKLWQMDAPIIVDAAWNAAVVSTLAIGAIVASMFMVGWAQELRIIPIPVQHCHYMSAVQTC